MATACVPDWRFNRAIYALMGESVIDVVYFSSEVGMDIEETQALLSTAAAALNVPCEFCMKRTYH